MLRITVLPQENGVTLKLEGRLVGAWADELKATILRLMPLPDAIGVEIGSLTFADLNGEQVLLWLQRMGATFSGDAPFSHGLCERLKIPLRA